MNKKPHKILYNSWYATEFEVTAEHQIALAKVMTNWVTDHEWHSKTTSLEFRFHVVMAENLGVGCLMSFRYCGGRCPFYGSQQSN